MNYLPALSDHLKRVMSGVTRVIKFSMMMHQILIFNKHNNVNADVNTPETMQ